MSITRKLLPVIGFVSLVVIAGCVAGSPQSTPTSPIDPTAATPSSATETPSPSPTANERETLPDPDTCSVDALPRPNTTDPQPFVYPSPPNNADREAAANWTLAFARAYEHNRIIAEELADEDMNLTDLTVYVEAKNVTRLRTGWSLVIVATASTGYEDDLHGDRTLDARYFVNESTMLRDRLDGAASDLSEPSGTVLLDCDG